MGKPFSFPSMIRFLPAAGLFASTLAFGLCASFYGRQITAAPSAASAAPFAAPFLLFAASTGASVALCAASLCDAADKKRLS
jgi:hypothetical protein